MQRIGDEKGVLRPCIKRLTSLMAFFDEGIYDPLTGLLNRRGLNQLLELTPAVKKTLRAVLFIDLNKFKEVNDLFGHATGDELLIHVASELANQIRPTDALARIGGDEFVIVAAGVASPHAAELFAKRLWSAVAAPFTFTNGST